jgi:hypothetical protein
VFNSLAQDAWLRRCNGTQSPDPKGRKEQAGELCFKKKEVIRQAFKKALKTIRVFA